MKLSTIIDIMSAAEVSAERILLCVKLYDQEETAKRSKKASLTVHACWEKQKAEEATYITPDSISHDINHTEDTVVCNDTRVYNNTNVYSVSLVYSI
ncbi:hypothetical protein [Bartonella ancashensis]|uniref:hypothetical protein n=1 Tax=Bartonella ancashensis TaxID=1318743 RepID=UPI0006B4254D|nr:hypothetical protein [Bartonella ancashensis]